MNRIILLICLLIGTGIFAQQNEDFAKVKEYYDYQRYMINKELKAKFEKESNVFEKTKIQNSFYDFMNKVDSIENRTYIRSLIVTKNREDLGNDFPKPKEENQIQNPPPPMRKTPSHHPSKDGTIDAEYPGGIDALREEVAHYFYLKAIDKKLTKASAKVYFIVEKDGRITHVKAKGENTGFNIQSEIAIYRLSKKFSPALVNGKPVRYRFSIPLTMHFE